MIHPGGAVFVNGYDRDNSHDDKPPTNWFAAVDRFHASALMRDYFGTRFVDMFSIVKRVEQDNYFSVVPALDYDWYLRNALKFQNFSTPRKNPLSQPPLLRQLDVAYR